ncbi:MAG: peptidoglycan DD-metalloendopeptidase family protein [Firmicutes bacterium]|nr:peptidoglycan DD-metalloendopeptidase family protein [Bacillota bacterium]
MKKLTEFITRRRKVMALVLSAALVFTMSSASYVYASQTISDVQNELDDVEDQKDQVKNDLAKVASDIKTMQATVNTLNANIKNTASEITSTEKKIEKKKKDMQKREEGLNERLRVMYKNGSVGFVDVLLGSGSVSEFLSNMDMIQRIYENDVEVMKTLQKEHEELEVIRKELKEKKVRLAAQKEEAAAKEVELNAKKKTLEEKEDELLEEAKALEAKLKQMVDASSPYVGGVFIWPVPSSHYITSYAGYRIHPVYKVWKYHSGMDISASGGANILAMGDGKVILSQAQPWYGGYGQCVMIDHGGGVVSLYAHCSKLLVSVGQTVKQGQVIALVGTTGTSTGNHLHVEVRENGTIVDPLTYIQG